MTHYLLDTNHAGALLRDDPRVIARIAALTDADLSVCLPSVGELWFMVYNSARAAENAARLTKLLARFRLVEYGLLEAEGFGRVRAELRREGRPIPQIDAQIAATTRVGGFVLLTSDAHFGHVSGLTIEDWMRP